MLVNINEYQLRKLILYHASELYTILEQDNPAKDVIQEHIDNLQKLIDNLPDAE